MYYDAVRLRADVQLLNVANDPTREVWREINRKFSEEYFEETGIRVDIRQSHGGSASQARSLLDGLRADVVALGFWFDTDKLRQRGLIATDWESRLPHRACPYYSTIVFVVRKGNPKQVRDWPDLVRPGVSVVTPNPKTSGNGKLSFLAAWGAVLERGGSDDDARAMITQLYRRVPALDTGARGATTTFAQNGIGDVQLTWENEAWLEVLESGGTLEIVYPPISIRADGPVAVVDSVVDAAGSRAAAEAYLGRLFEPRYQELLARHHLRPANDAVRARFADAFPEIRLFTIDSIAPSWAAAQERFFGVNGEFDRLYLPQSP